VQQKIAIYSVNSRKISSWRWNRHPSVLISLIRRSSRFEGNAIQWQLRQGIPDKVLQKVYILDWNADQLKFYQKLPNLTPNLFKCKAEPRYDRLWMVRKGQCLISLQSESLYQNPNRTEEYTCGYLILLSHKFYRFFRGQYLASISEMPKTVTKMYKMRSWPICL
jgi:hypothetical protein